MTPGPEQISSDVLIIGGGLSGLAAAWQLHRQGIDVVLLEARPRLGGRILTLNQGRGAYDLGPSWIWPGQPLVASLLKHFAIPVFGQFAEGALRFQGPDGRLDSYPGLAPMGNALRIAGGVGTLIEALGHELPKERVLLRHKVTSVTFEAGQVLVQATGESGQIAAAAKSVAVAIPPRLAAGISYHPALDAKTLQAFEATPTWMAGHAKFVALYATPFWRAQGLSGDAISHRGPLAEVHDAAPASGGPYALFGFLGVDAESRSGMDPEDLIGSAVSQLAEVFGSPAAAPLHSHLQDWSREAFTATESDRTPPGGHPAYGLAPDLGEPWAGRLHFIATETAFQNGGLIEGALEGAAAFARDLLKARSP